MLNTSIGVCSNRAPNKQEDKTVIKPVVQKNNYFDEFWKAYPRKTNKGFARKVFEKLKVDDAMLTKMIQAIYVQNKNVWKDKDQQYIPHPSTWLNGERWDDEVVVKPMSASDREKARIFG
jgi:hypothetical protein